MTCKCFSVKMHAFIVIFFKGCISKVLMTLSKFPAENPLNHNFMFFIYFIFHTTIINAGQVFNCSMVHVIWDSKLIFVDRTNKVSPSRVKLLISLIRVIALFSCKRTIKIGDTIWRKLKMLRLMLHWCWFLLVVKFQLMLVCLSKRSKTRNERSCTNNWNF